jgi:trimethylamine corrinoid protein
MLNDNFSAMRQSIIDGAPDTASSLAQQAVSGGVAPIDAINNGYVLGMHDVGEQFARGQMYLPDMMASAEAMRAAMAVLDPEMKKLGTARPMAGVVVLGTTKGDIHEIGKILVGTLLTAHGFRVHDLGVDVAGEKFAAKAQELNADIVGVSALLTTTMRNQKGVVEAIEKAGLRPSVKIMVGGAPVTRRWAEEIGADGYAKDAMSAVELARQLMEQKTPPAVVEPV